MRKNNKYKYLILAVVFIAFVMGAYTLLRPPESKPFPSVPLPTPVPAPAPAEPQPIPNVPLFDVSKYKSEPTISVYHADQGSVDNMPLETYLEGVTAQEMDPTWPVEALSAQAIACRTLTMNAIEAGTIKKLHHADVSTSKDELQAYAPKRVNENVKTAVQKTRGQVLLYAGSLVNAIYSSSNGQIAATKEESFPLEIEYPTPYFQPVTDNSYTYTPANLQNWSVKIPGTEVAKACGYQGNPADISILEKGPSGRILYIGAGNKKIYGATFRKLIGYDRLKSTLISDLTYDGSQFTFYGHGWGNGVGLCQWGAYTFAQQGMQAEDIVKYYYVGTTVHKLYE
ncbi:stage II sporulation protein D [Sporomusaceae bacterium BoRhaA]|uniref:SpoIID/LytB domain-containing protein n=1 Tax=Pelorhabdus rhamnosifermentans TaxID=2772457 RepID=UPI001C062663|nr:SpoIID/LytB domain-containing protein [Pelorhabdus rhamnosifermentans]MBU2700704.1 stage II sporulation protein D [Pelorhabdus rhamnosifermentans]